MMSSARCGTVSGSIYCPNHLALHRPCVADGRTEGHHDTSHEKKLRHFNDFEIQIRSRWFHRPHVRLSGLTLTVWQTDCRTSRLISWKTHLSYSSYQTPMILIFKSFYDDFIDTVWNWHTLLNKMNRNIGYYIITLNLRVKLNSQLDTPHKSVRPFKPHVLRIYTNTISWMALIQSVWVDPTHASSTARLL